MRSVAKQFNFSMIATAVFGVIIGILLLVFPDDSLKLAAKGIAVIIFLMGLVSSVATITGRHIAGSVVAGIVAVFGIWLFMNPGIVVSIIPIIVGVFLVVSGVRDFVMAIEGIRKGATYKVLLIVIALASVIFGMICISNAFGIMSLTTRIIGIIIIFNALTDIFVSLHIGNTRRAYDKSESIVDVEEVIVEDVDEN